MSTVLITGANGFIAVPITRILLERGYNVVGTVRSLSKTDYLRKKFSAYGDKLKFAVVEDITRPGAHDQVLQDYRFDAVLHTSSPFTFEIKDVAKELLEPAVKGTTEILKSIHAHAPSVKRVVVTSSFASVVNREKGNWPGHVYTEKDWNPVTYEEGLVDAVNGYYASKKLAEEAAWDFMKDEKPSFALTTLCPPMVWGPPEQEVTSVDNLNTSAHQLYSILNGLSEPEVGVWLWVDVRDIALAHVLAIESPAAAGQRYLVSSGQFSPQQFVDFVWAHHPDRAQAKNVTKGTPGKLYPEEGMYTSDNSKSVRDLGMKYRGLEDTLKDTWEAYEEIEKRSQ